MTHPLMKEGGDGFVSPVVLEPEAKRLLAGAVKKVAWRDAERDGRPEPQQITEIQIQGA
jgi:hypothetical protein